MLHILKNKKIETKSRNYIYKNAKSVASNLKNYGFKLLASLQMSSDDVFDIFDSTAEFALDDVQVFVALNVAVKCLDAFDVMAIALFEF